MSDVRWKELRNKLLQERDNITNRIQATGEYGLDDSMADQLSELSMYDNHPGDIGSEMFERGKDIALRDNDLLVVQEIDRALQAMDSGSYGTCQVCQQPIPYERLEARPSATLCVNCKAVDENEHPDRERPIEEEFLTPGFARTDTDDTESVVFDGEDSWQSVERFNYRSGYIHMYEESTYDEHVGIVDPMDQISNEEYKDQLP